VVETAKKAGIDPEIVESGIRELMDEGGAMSQRSGCCGKSENDKPFAERTRTRVENTIRTLVIADIHLGIEWELYHSGISIPSQVEKRTARIREYIKKVDPERIVLLGDIKHNVPRTSWQEKQEVPAFLEELAGFAPVDIMPGNHDGDIGELIPENVTMHNMRGFVIDGVGYFHGHTWPDDALLCASQVVMSHNHPTIRLVDTLGHGVSEPVWIRTRFIEKRSWNIMETCCGAILR